MRSISIFMICLGLLALAAPADAAIFTFIANLDGPSESPPVASAGTGTALVTLDTTAHTYSVFATFSGLTGVTTIAHIHAPTAVANAGTVGVATHPGTFPGFPVGVTSGTYAGTFDMTQTSIYTAPFLALGGGTAAGAESLLLSSIQQGRAYFNIHTNFAPGGEIRGFLRPVPEPSSCVLFGAGCIGLLVHLRRRRMGASVSAEC